MQQELEPVDKTAVETGANVSPVHETWTMRGDIMEIIYYSQCGYILISLYKEVKVSPRPGEQHFTNYLDININ